MPTPLRLLPRAGRAVLAPLALLLSFAYATWGGDAGESVAPPPVAARRLAAPVITFQPASGASYTGTTATRATELVVGVCSEGVFTGSSPRQVKLNGVDVTSGFGMNLPMDPDAYIDCNTSMELTGTVALVSGTNTLWVSITDGSGNRTTTATYTYTQATYTPAVTPDGGTASHAASGSARSASFTVTNNGNTATPYTVTPACTGVLTSCGVGSSTTATVQPGQSTTVAVSYVGSTVGTGRVRLEAKLGTVTSDTGWVDVTVTAAPTEVSVTPDAGVAAVTASASAQTRSFGVQNTGASSSTYTLDVACTGALASCSAPASVAVGAGATQSVNVSYVAAAAGSGRMRLRAQAGTAPADSGWVTLDVWPTGGTAQAPVVTVAEPNPGTSVSRGMCLTVAISGDAAAECGDLRVAHALPGVVTMNKGRGLTLLYNSQHAHPSPTVAVNVRQATTTSRPDSVTAKLFIGTEAQPVASGKWTGTDWSYASTRRIALSFDALSRATGKYDYRMEVKNHYSTGAQTANATGRLVVVNRSATPYRPGWWPAGVEELKVLGTDTVLWIGGDGSTRLYARATGSTVFRAENVTRPDTLTLPVPGGDYTRWLPGGVRVVFDFGGRHVQTIGRRGTTTTFSYANASARRLYRVTLPVISGTAPFYEFAYTNTATDTLVSSVTAPPAGSVTRVTQVRWDAGTRRLTFVEPDTMSKVRFDHDATVTRRIVKRIDRNGDVTEYTFRTGGTVVSGRRYMSGTTAAAGDIITTLIPLEARGLPGAPAVDTARAYAHVDGARNDVAGDTVIFRLDRFGAPRQVVDPLGRATTLTRGNATYPALVTQTTSPAGTSTAAYDALARLTSTTTLNPLGTGVDATTQYRYDATWKDFPTRVVAPLGDSTVMAYDANGDRIWQQPGADATRRTYFVYSAQGQVIRTRTARQDSAGTGDSIVYDARGNVKMTRSALGYLSLVTRDAIGRDSIGYSAVDSVMARDTAALKAGGAKTYTTYDRLGRVTSTRSVGPARVYPQRLDHGSQWTSATHPGLELNVANTYDPEGRLLRVERWSTPDTAHLGHLVTKWTYDRAGRQVEERGPDTTKVTTRHYNAAGMDTVVITRRGETLRKVYDVAGRLTTSTTSAVTYQTGNLTYPGLGSRTEWYFPRFLPNADGTFLTPSTGATSSFTVPGDTAVFTYDPATDAMLSAVNRSAKVLRGYFPNGALRADTLIVFPSDGRSETDHKYVLSYSYDLNGRRTDMYAPSQLVQGAAWMGRTRYQYDAVTGALSRIDSGADTADYRYTFAYDRDGQLTGVTYLETGLVTESYQYDLDGQLRIQQRRRGGSLIHADTFTYDGAGRRARVGTMADSVLNVYGPLGALMWSFTDRRNADTETEEFNLTDAMANVASTRHIYHTTGPKATDLNTTDVTRHLYEQGNGRLDFSETWNGAQTVKKDGTNNTVYDASGNKSMYSQSGPVPYSGLVNGTGQLQEWTWLYYGADEKLRVLDRTSCVLGTTTGGTYGCWAPPYDSRPTFEEYRYDALGRRVMTITDQTWACSTYCVTAETRTVWDGDQIIAEVRSPRGSQQDTGPMEEGETMHPRQMGRVLYTHGLGLDKPLLLARIDYDSFFPGTQPIIPHTNWLGNYDSGTFVAHGNGTGPACVQRPRMAVDATPYPSNDPDAGSGRGFDSISICYDVAWPASYMWNSKVRIDRGKFGPPSWMGSLVEGGKDASGQMYMRNRYYDPGTGRFTQEDPIGLAGGINLYGFAGGDPVNFSDPYGLKGAPVDEAAEDDEGPPRLRRLVFGMTGTNVLPPKSCDCDVYGQLEYEPLTEQEAIEAGLSLGDLELSGEAAVGLGLSVWGGPAGPYIAGVVTVALNRKNARNWEPRAGDQMTITTTEKYDPDGSRGRRTQTVVITRADGTVVRN